MLVSYITAGSALEFREHLAPPLVADVARLLLAHLEDHYTLYGELTGVRSARKHIGWYVAGLAGGDVFRAHMNTLDSSAAQLAAVADFFAQLGEHADRMPAAAVAAAASITTTLTTSPREFLHEQAAH